MATLKETLLLLKNAHVSESLYVVGGLGDGECVGIAHDNDGVWRTYFSERGARRNIVEHPSEAAACAAFTANVAETVEAWTGKRPDFS
jgi:hypothetical protein